MFSDLLWLLISQLGHSSKKVAWLASRIWG
jgi:hypothetical protein